MDVRIDPIGASHDHGNHHDHDHDDYAAAADDDDDEEAEEDEDEDERRPQHIGHNMLHFQMAPNHIEVVTP